MPVAQICRRCNADLRGREQCPNCGAAVTNGAAPPAPRPVPARPAPARPAQEFALGFQETLAPRPFEPVPAYAFAGPGGRGTVIRFDSINVPTRGSAWPRILVDLLFVFEPLIFWGVILVAGWFFLKYATLNAASMVDSLLHALLGQHGFGQMVWSLILLYVIGSYFIGMAGGGVGRGRRGSSFGMGAGPWMMLPSILIRIAIQILRQAVRTVRQLVNVMWLRRLMQGDRSNGRTLPVHTIEVQPLDRGGRPWSFQIRGVLRGTIAVGHVIDVNGYERGGQFVPERVWNETVRNEVRWGREWTF